MAEKSILERENDFFRIYKDYANKPGLTQCLLLHSYKLSDYQITESLRKRGIQHPTNILNQIKTDREKINLNLDDYQLLVKKNYTGLLPPQDRLEFIERFLTSGSWKDDPIMKRSIYLLRAIAISSVWNYSKPKDPEVIIQGEVNLFTKLFKFSFLTPYGLPEEELKEYYEDPEFNPFTVIEERGFSFYYYDKPCSYYVIPPHMKRFFMDNQTFFKFFPEAKDFYGTTKTTKKAT